MSIQGIGSDIVHIPRIEKLINEQGEAFLQRVFTDAEVAYARQKSGGDAVRFASTLAKRWAAKEAVVKALGTGFGNGLYWSQVEIMATDGAPKVVLHGVAETKPYREWHVSMSDDYPYALAFVVLSKGA